MSFLDWTVERRRLIVSTLLACALTICAADAQQWPTSNPPGPLTARPVDFPPYEIKTLPNGLQVLVVLHHEQPSVSFRLLVRAGAMQEPADRPGVANFVSGLLTQGTKTEVGRRHRQRPSNRPAASSARDPATSSRS